MMKFIEDINPAAYNDKNSDATLPTLSYVMTKAQNQLKKVRPTT